MTSIIVAEFKAKYINKEKIFMLTFHDIFLWLVTFCL